MKKNCAGGGSRIVCRYILEQSSAEKIQEGCMMGKLQPNFKVGYFWWILDIEGWTPKGGPCFRIWTSVPSSLTLPHMSVPRLSSVPFLVLSPGFLLLPWKIDSPPCLCPWFSHPVSALGCLILSHLLASSPCFTLTQPVGGSCGSRILVRGPVEFWLKGAWAQTLLNIGVFPLQLPQNCMILEKSWGQGGPGPPGSTCGGPLPQHLVFHPASEYILGPFSGNTR